MRTGHLSTLTLVTGVLAFVGCGTAEPEGDGTTGGAGPGGSQSTGGVNATGGTQSSGGTSSGGSPTGGQGGGSSGTAGTGAVATGGSAGSGGSVSTGGATGGDAGTGNATTGGSGGSSMGGAAGSPGGSSMGGRGGSGGASGAAGNSAGTGGKGGSGGGSGTCTTSKSVSMNSTGTGPHDVVVETNSDAGIRCGTIYRPADLAGAEKFPIFVWGEGGCSQNGQSNQAAMSEIASWAIAENGKSCSAYYQKLETTKIAADGFSCGGLMAENVSDDPRFTAIGITSSGLMGANAALYQGIHTPFKIMNGGSSDIAYENGLRDYQQISALGKPVIYFSKTSAGHGGDLSNGRGDFNRVNLAWLNWQLKGDMGATGKGFLYGSSCMFCTDAGWDYMSANIQ